jgi:hypothetical protein
LIRIPFFGLGINEFGHKMWGVALTIIEEICNGDWLLEKSVPL